MKTAGFVGWLAIGACLAAFSGCSSGDGKTGAGDAPAATDETVRKLPPIVGTPTDAGVFDGGATLLGSAEPDSGEALMPTTQLNLMAIRLEVEQAATLVPAEYSVVVDKRRYRPKAVSFGEARETFFSLKKFAADEIKLQLGGSDQITTNRAGQLNGCRLASGEVYLLFRVPPFAVVALHYDGKEYDLRPTDATALGIEPSATQTAATDDTTSKPAGPRDVQLKLKRGQLAIGVLDDEETEVFELELTLSSSKYETVELHLGRDFFLEGNASPENSGRKAGRRSRTVFVEMQEDHMRLLAGTDYYDNTYKDKPMKELENGGLAVSLEPGRPITLFFVFPKPPFANGLSLHFPNKPPLDVVSSGDVLGEIRPAIPRGVAKIPRAPLVGQPVKVHIVAGDILVDAGGQSLTPQQPGAGKQFVVLTFTIQGEQQFVPRDYLVRDAANTNYYPVAVAFGHAPARRIPGDGYEPIKLVPGEKDIVRKRNGKRLYWQYARPEFLVLFALPQSLTTFDFSHGNRLLKITPATPPTAWKELRPAAALTTDDGNTP